MIEIDGIPPILEGLRTDLGPALQAGAVAIAHEVERRIAPYPPSRSRTYIRGYGRRGGKKTSENLGRRWSVEPQPFGAQLVNTASYAGWVHDAKNQARVHAATGWVTDQEAAASVEQDGTVEQIMTDAVRHTMRIAE